MNYQQLINYRDHLNHFAKETGVRTVEVREGYARCTLELEARHFNVVHSVHGGALYTLMDSVGGATAASYGYQVTTMSSNVLFLNAVRDKMKLYAVGHAVKHGRKLTVVDVRVCDYEGKIYTQGTFTFYNLDAPIKMGGQ